jgi:predicted CoA-binding protein
VDKIIKLFIEQKKLAIVGASRNGKKFGNAAAKELRQRGYEILIIHPEAHEIDGHKTYPNLTAIKGQVESMLVSISTEHVRGILWDAANNGIKNVWLQQGIDASELKELATELNLNIVDGKCILMYAEPVGSIHKFHQVVWKLIGQY